MCYHCVPFHSSLGIHVDLRKGEGVRTEGVILRKRGRKDIRRNSEKKGEGEEKACHSGQ